MPNEEFTEGEKYLMTIAGQAGELVQGVPDVKELVEQTKKDKRAAYTNPAAAANIINRYKESISQIKKNAGILIKKYGRSLEDGFVSLLKRLYGNVYNAQQYLANVDAAANEVRENARKAVEAIPKK